MKVAGIICEYNPFHSGHAEHIARTRAVLGADGGVICVMGGNFVQRGEPALLMKHARAEMAVRCGADLVLELPVPWATASAERFAMGGVSVLDSCGIVDIISFGSECGDVERLRGAADALLTPEADGLILRELASGISYAAARERAAEALIGCEAELLREPNNILAVEYLKALRRLGSAIEPVTFGRMAVGHDGGAADGIASASHIRKLIYDGRDAAEFMPRGAYEVLEREISCGRAPVSPKAMEDMLLYRLRTMTDAEFEALPDTGGGLWRRFARLARSAPTYESFLDGTKTKRYARSRLRRMALAALLGVRDEGRTALPPYIRVLAFGGRGRALLKSMRKAALLPIITKPAAARALPEDARDIFALEARAGDIYALLMPAEEMRRGGSEWTRGPVNTDKV